MITRFLSLEWKQFFRSSYWQKSVALNVLLIFVALYFIATFLALGFGLYPLLKQQFPEKDPLNLVNGAVFFWLLADLMMRFFFQKLPVMSVKPLLILPVKRKSIIHFVLGKSVFSFFNFLPLFAIIPFGLVLIKNDYAIAPTLTWMILMTLLSLCVHFTNFIIESKTAESELSFLPVIIITGGLFALDYFHLIPLAEWLEHGISAISNNPVLLLIPAGLLAGLYLANFNILKQKLYIDDSLKSDTKDVTTLNMDWTQRFGNLAPFIQLDLKMIWRNKRTRSTVFIMIFGLVYGLLFYPNPRYQEMTPMLIFIAIFITGIFMINFGQFIPAWDSAYYKLLMSQNIRYKDYLRSKFVLMALSAVILFILSIPYVYFGWKILLFQFAAMVYNIGVNSHLLLYGGSFNRKRIDLSQRAAFNYQGTGAVQWIIGFPLILFPILFFYLPYKFFGYEAGIATLIILGGIGILFHQKIMNIISKRYFASKYDMINAFDQTN